MNKGVFYAKLTPITNPTIGLIMKAHKARGIFYSESFTLVLKKDGVKAPEGCAEEIKAYLDAHEDVESWLIVNAYTGFELPERYRIEVTKRENQDLEIKFHQLRCESKPGFAEHI